MEIVVAESAGFCYGVANAVKKVEDTIAAYTDKKIFTLGPIIHNENIVDEFKRQGVGVINNPQDAEAGSIVIIRAHGIGRQEYKVLAERGAEIIDATCPYVKKIHSLVEDMSNDGYVIIVAGDKSHPEVKGTCGWVNGEAFVLEDEFGIHNEALIETVKASEKVCIVSQTTISYEKWKKIIKSCKKIFDNIKNFDTICSATKKRQEETAVLAKDVDIMVVIGSKSSSNTIKLLEVSKNNCEKTCLIERAEDLTPYINNFKKVGVTAGASTPDSIIREVISRMSEQNIIENGQTFAEMVEGYIDIDEVKTGKVLTGTVVRITEEGVFVDIGAKAEGMIPITEFTNDPNFRPGVSIKEGDEIEAKIFKISDKEGTITLSKRDLERAKRYKQFKELMESGEIVEAKVLNTIKGGVIAKCLGSDIFIPLSLLSDRYIQKADNYVGQTIRIKIVSVDEKKRSVKGSAKPVIIQEKMEAEKAIWEKLSIGDTVEGIVKNFTDFRAFVDLGGIDGSIHISELSWNRVKHPSDVLTTGDKVEVKILDMNSETKKISLGYRKAEDNPWFNAEEKYAVGTIVTGTVVRILNFGAFVELEKGIDALVHISRISNFRIAKVEESLAVGQSVTGKVIEFDAEAKKVGVSIKDVEPIDPPERVAEAAEKARIAEEKEAERAAQRQAKEEERARIAADRAAARAEKAAEPTGYVETLNNSIADKFAGLFNGITISDEETEKEEQIEEQAEEQAEE